MDDTYWRARLVAQWPVHRAAPTRSATRDLTLDLYIPETERRGVIVYIHGGGWETGTNDRPPGFRTVLRHGYALSAIQYRFATEVAGATLAEDIRDALAATQDLTELEGVPAERWYLWGVSAGGHLASLTAHRMALHPRSNDPAICAVASWCGPMDIGAYGRLTDVDEREREMVRRIVGQLTDGDDEAARALSPIMYAGPDSVPHLFVHGDEDGLVPPSQSETMYRALRESGVRAEYLRLPGGAHAMPPGDSREIRRTLAFFDEIGRDDAHRTPSSKPPRRGGES